MAALGIVLMAWEQSPASSVRSDTGTAVWFSWAPGEGKGRAPALRLAPAPGRGQSRGDFQHRDCHRFGARLLKTAPTFRVCRRARGRFWSW